MSDQIRSISQNNYLLAAQQEVSHDNTLSGNGTPESPIGVNHTITTLTGEAGCIKSKVDQGIGINALTQAYKVDNLVSLTLGIDPMAVINIPKHTWTKLATVVDTLKPVIDTYTIFHNSNGEPSMFGFLKIDASGDVYVYQEDTTNMFVHLGQFTYFTA